MKKFTKLFLSCAIVSVVAVASAAMAFADGEAPATYEIKPETGSTLAGTYTVSSNDVTLSGVTPDANTQVTFLVYKQGADATTVAADDVIGIDQFASGEAGATSVQPTNKGLKEGSVVVPEKGQNTYNVKVGYYEGGTFKTASATFVTGEAAGEEIVLGDVDGITGVDAYDAISILWYGVKPDGTERGIVGKTIKLTDGTEKVAGDVDGITGIDAYDAIAVLWYGVKPDGTERGEVGNTVVGTIVDAPVAN